MCWQHYEVCGILSEEDTQHPSIHKTQERKKTVVFTPDIQVHARVGRAKWWCCIYRIYGSETSKLKIWIHILLFFI